MARIKQAAKRTWGNPRRDSRASASSSAPKKRATKSQRKDPESSGGGGRKKPRRFKAGTRSLQEIRKLQKSVELLIPVAQFIRAVREITSYMSTEVTRWQAEALHALQVAAEDFLIQLFEDTVLCAVHAKRVTVMQKDMELARRLGKKGQPW